MVSLLRILVRTLFKILFRVKVQGEHNYTAAGPRVLIVANHTSLLDGILFYLFLPERPTFAINTGIAEKWYFQPFLLFVDMFKLDRNNALATKALIKFLREDRKAVIFPEGRITTTGTIMKVYDGPGLVADKAEAMVLPVGVEGAQYSTLSYLKGLVRRRWFPRIRITILPPRRLQLAADLRGPARRKAAAQAMTETMQEIAFHNCDIDRSLFEGLCEAISIHGRRRIILEDVQRIPLSYQQLMTRTMVLSAAVSNEFKSGETVGVLLPNTNAVIATILAIHSRGAIPAMFNYTIGAKGLISSCETARVKIVFTSRRFVEQANLAETVEIISEQVRLIYLEDLRERISWRHKLQGLVGGRFPKWSYRRLAGRVGADDTAVILFTSGSEGIPKGVALSHRNLLANRAQVTCYLDFTTRDQMLNVLPVFHAFGLTGGVVIPLLSGTRVFMYPTPLHYHIIPELAYDIGATILFGSNTFLAGYARHADQFDFHRMRYVVAGAEKLQEDTRRIWMEKFGIRVLEGYGATETSPVLSVNAPTGCKVGTVGRPLTQVGYYLEPVEGITDGGRLVVRGPNIMKGYLYHGGDGRIVPPSASRGQGWYDTGDIADVDEDGFITIRGRAKRFANVGGEMVSLGAIEELVQRLWPEASHAAVSIADSKKGEQIYLATTQPDAERRDIVDAVKTGGLSEMLVPRQLLVVTQIPQLGSGKADYQAVKELFL
jgi:acyl-[acyl-carrier-protein]-phospholipid O-acyltransferase/long-chain-fatty-acid--[acyl-carrier-protein] ligase